MNTMVASLFALIILVFLPKNVEAQWISRSGPGGGNISAVAANQSGVYAANGSYTPGFFLYSTINDGQNWTQSDSGLLSRIYALGASSTSVFAGTPSGLYSTSDDGHTWLLSLPKYIRSIMITGDADVFVGTTNGLHYSSDNGSTWSSPILGGDIYDLAATGTHIFANVSYGLVQSSDFGTSWQALNVPLSFAAYSLYADSNFLLVGGGDRGVLVSPDKGTTWINISAGLTHLGPTQLDPVYEVQVMGQHFIAGTPHGIYTCLQSDTVWIPTNFHSSVDYNFDVRSIVRKGDMLFAGSGTGIWVSPDSGLSWMPVTNGLPPTTVTAMIKTGSALIVGTLTNAYSSDDDGLNWSFVPGLTGNVRNFLEVNSILFAATSTGIFRSTDLGMSWTESDSGIPGDATGFSVAANSNYLFAGINRGSQLATIYRSSDQGLSWTLSDSGLMLAYSIDMLGEKNGRMYVGLSTGLYQSTDNGASWIPANTAIRGASSFAAIDNEIFISTYSYSLTSQLFRSSNDGISWISIALPPPGIRIQTLYSSGDRLFVGTVNDGIYSTSDKGSTWESINYGLTSSASSVLSFTHDAVNIYCGTTSGVWYRPISDVISDAHVEPEAVPGPYMLQQNYPNPFNPVTTISYSLSLRERVRISVFNLLGMEIRVLVDEVQGPGTLAVPFDGSDLPSGVYVCKLNVGSFTDVKKMILLR